MIDYLKLLELKRQNINTDMSYESKCTDIGVLNYKMTLIMIKNYIDICCHNSWINLITSFKRFSVCIHKFQVIVRNLFLRGEFTILDAFC